MHLFSLKTQIQIKYCHFHFVNKISINLTSTLSVFHLQSSSVLPQIQQVLINAKHVEKHTPEISQQMNYVQETEIIF